jgi:hypothetical protein
MADDGTEISALPAVSSAANTDIFPVVQGGETKKESLTQAAAAILAEVAAQGNAAALATDDYVGVTQSGVAKRATMAQMTTGVMSLLGGLTAVTTPATTDLVGILQGSNAYKITLAQMRQIVNKVDSFFVTKSGTQSINDNSATKIVFPTEAWDIAGTFDNVTNYRHTPTTAGKYLYGLVFRFNASVVDQGRITAAVYKGGASALSADFHASGTGAHSAMVFGVLSMNGSSNYVEFYVLQDNSSDSALTMDSAAANTFAFGMLIEPA